MQGGRGIDAVRMSTAATLRRQRERLPEAASLLLDVIRFGLALLVLVGHTSIPFFSLGWPPLLFYADIAVPGFFVLSGFMIRYVTEDRERDPKRYFISRASRMYSVLLPALVLSAACGMFVSRVAPSYWRLFTPPQSAPAVLGHAAAHLLFLTQFWGHAVLFPPDLPLWSLGYEVPYYVLFGLVMLCRGRLRWWLAAAYALVVGPQVLFLLPLWWSGCWLYDAWQWMRAQGGARTTVAGLGALVVLLWITVPLGGVTGWSRIAALPHPLQWIGMPPMRALMSAYASGLGAWAAMLLGLIGSDRVQLQKNAPWARPVRRLAEGTFTLYLFHFPLLCLIVPLHHGQLLHRGSTTLLVDVAIVLACVAAAVPVDRLKSWMRRRLTVAFA